MALDGIYINNIKQKFLPQDILEGDISEYTGPLVEAVEDWMEENIEPGAATVIDKTLAIEGAAADAKKTGDEFDDVKKTLNTVKNVVFEKNYVIDTTDAESYESAPSSAVRIAHPYAFVQGTKYTLEVQIESATFKTETNAIMADTSSVTGDSTSYLNTNLLRVNNNTSHTIATGDIYTVEFTATATDKNILIRYKFAAGTQSIKVLCYKFDSVIDGIESDISDINETIHKTTICIDATDTGSYGSAPSATIAKPHLYEFKAGKTYKATLKVNSGTFKSETQKIRLNQSAALNDSTANLLGSAIFSIDNPVIGTVYEATFVAEEGCRNLLARYKWGAGEQSVDLDVTLAEDAKQLIDNVESEIAELNAASVINCRMQMGAHRGAESYAPPNSVAAYEIAGKMGFPWAWLAQVRWSAENTLYVMHDEDVSITTNGTGNISDLTDEYIDSLLCNKIDSYDYSKFTNDDLRVPTLEKVIQICLRYGMKMCFRVEPFPSVIETERHQEIWDNFVGLIKAYGIAPDEASYSAYNPNAMRLCLQLIGDVEICPYEGNSFTAQDYVDWFAERSDFANVRKAVLMPVSALSLSEIKTLHTNNIRVYAFSNSTRPTKTQMENLAMWGADILQNPAYARIPL